MTSESTRLERRRRAGVRRASEGTVRPRTWPLLHLTVAASLLSFVAALPVLAERSDPRRWESYLDYAYVYSSAEPAALDARLEEYSREAGVTLDEYLVETIETAKSQGLPLDEIAVRRLAIGNLLLYLASREKVFLDRSVDAIDAFDGKNGRHEDLYWLHYIHAQMALERENPAEFVKANLDLWLDVIVPLESSYDTLEALSLAQSQNSGFVSALPYLFENIARLILIRSQEMGMNRELDPLVAIVRLLGDGRVGAHPDVIPRETSSTDYVARIIERVNGWESDGGSLTFTLALFEAARYHERARGLLASDGFTEETIKAIRVASGAYQTALDRSETLQGRAAVYIRVLRQLGEVYAAKQRLGVDPDIETSFQIEGSIDAYAALFDVRLDEGWRLAGFQNNGRDAYVAMMHALWEEIQEAHLNAADYYLARSTKEKLDPDELVRNASRVYERYLSFFLEFATPDSWELIPDSAYFAAYESAKGFGDSYLAYMKNSPTPKEIEHASDLCATGVKLYPFDRQAWSTLARSLERRGRSNDYLSLARPIADTVVRSRNVHQWVKDEEPGFQAIGAMRRALGDDLVLMYLGFATGSGGSELETNLAELEATRDALVQKIATLERQAGPEESGAPPASPASASPSGSEREVAATGASLSRAERQQILRDIHQASGQLEKIERQITGRARALPLYNQAGEGDALIGELRAQRDHPVHKLLRRLHHEQTPTPEVIKEGE